MAFHPFEASIPHIAYAVLGGFVVFFGMFSLFIREKLYIGEACWAFLFGVIIGPYGANIFNPRGWGNGEDSVTNTITLEFTRVVLAIGVFAIGVELPKAYMARHWKSLFYLIVPVMTWGWFVSAGLIYALIPKLNFLSSLAVAACLTPTDPILAAAVVGGKYADKHVPAHLRHLLAAESGCNDGAAFPFLYISLYLIMDKTTGQAVGDWFLRLWLYQIILGTVWGAMLGFGFRHLMKFCERNDLIDRQSYVAQYVSLALLTIGTTTMLGSDDLLAAFSCGTAFAWDGFFNKQTEQAVFSSVIDLLFNVAAFVFVGAWTPFTDFDNAELSITVWRLVVIAILVLLLRRLPAMIALYKFIPDVKNFREAVFSGHFGPMGIGAVFISTLAAETLTNDNPQPGSQKDILADAIQPIVAFMVVTSIVIHGLSIPFFTFGRRVHTVSRTWSVRRAETAPEWTTHTRPITRGEDIVINRDTDANAMERGEASTGTGTGTADEKSSTVGELTPPRLEESEDTKMEGSPEEKAKAENVPDGDEVFQEWQEGSDRVIERRAGPGEEVEVEVQKNAYEPSDAERFTRGLEGQDASSAADAFVGGLKSAPHEVEKRVGQAEEEAEGAADRVTGEAESVAESAEHDFVSRVQGDEDEGWASDRSGPSEQETRKRGKGKKKPPLISVGGRAGRKKGSIHRAFTTPRSQTGPSASPENLSTEDEPRGRLPLSPIIGTETRSVARRRAPHMRIQSLRGSEASSVREASPARSVRFADEADRGWNGSGPGTPRGLSSLSVPGSQVPSDDEGEDAGGVGDITESPRNRVTFDLPERG